MIGDSVLYHSLFCDAIFAITEATELTFLVGERDYCSVIWRMLLEEEPEQLRSDSMNVVDIILVRGRAFCSVPHNGCLSRWLIFRFTRRR